MNTERTVTYAARAKSPIDILMGDAGTWTADRNGDFNFDPSRDNNGRRFLIHIEDVTPEPELWYAARGAGWVRAHGSPVLGSVGFNTKYPVVTVQSVGCPPDALRDELFAARDLLVKHGLME